MLEKKMLELIFRNIDEVNFEVNYWDGESKKFCSGEKQKPDFKITFNKKLDLNEIRKQPQLKLGEYYMKGDIELEGSLRDFFKQAVLNISDLDEKFKGYHTNSFWNRQKESSFDEQKQGIQKHYELGNDFFRLWQDETMTYSCAYFKSKGDDLKQAQLQKNDHILKKLNLNPQERLLDIGCGWGSLAIRAAKIYDVDVLGITLSQKQVDGARKKVAELGLEEKIKIKKQDFRDLAELNKKFDKIVSIGMFEHVGKEHIPEYFDSIDKMLVPGGLSLLHTITHLKEQPTNAWLEKYIFPWGYIPSLREIVWQLPENNFHLLDVEDIGFHYSLTAEHWADNYEKVTEQVREKFDDEFVRMWRLFLAGVVVSFRYTGISVHQLLFSKGKNIELPLTREYIYK